MVAGNLPPDGPAPADGYPGAGAASGTTYPTVVGTPATGSGTYYGLTPVTLPSGIVAGDLIVIFFATPNNGLNWNVPGGYTAFIANTTMPNARIGGWYKVAVGGDTLGYVSSVSDANMGYSWTSYAFRGQTGAPEGVYNSTVSSTSSDPAALTPSWGSKACIWLVVDFEEVSYNSATAPAGYGNGTAYAPGGGVVGIRSWRKTATAVSDDPASFVNGTQGTPTRCATVAIRGT